MIKDLGKHFSRKDRPLVKTIPVIFVTILSTLKISVLCEVRLNSNTVTHYFGHLSDPLTTCVHAPKKILSS
jgi:hypothetical protein